MHKRTIILLFLGFLPFLAAAQTGSISVTIEGVINETGQIGVLLFNREKGFPGDDKASIRQELLPAKKGNMTVRFDDLPHGTYAITVMHDENKNLKVDTNMLGIPKEGYGFSNNARNLFRAPYFREAAFDLKSGSLVQTIKLMY
jgi:uncharacterized protein (DUF2141 family)